MRWPRLFTRAPAALPPAQARRYDAASPARTRFNAGASRFSSYGPETAAANSTIRSRARHATENNSMAAAAVSAWTDAAVGAGIMPISQHADPKTRALLDSYFERWARHADASGRTDFWGLQAAVVRSERIDGDSMLIWRGDKLLHLPPEQIADWTTDTAVSGVELDDDGRAKGYWIHPGRPDGVNSQYAPPVFVDAADALHIFRASGPGQVRGVSALAPVLLTLNELDGTEDALILQTKIAAMLSVILTNEGEMSADDPLEDGQSL